MKPYTGLLFALVLSMHAAAQTDWAAYLQTERTAASYLVANSAVTYSSAGQSHARIWNLEHRGIEAIQSA